MAKTVAPIKCTHEHLSTTASAARVREGGRVVGYRLYVEAKCKDCGIPFHFPNYVREDDESKVVNHAVVSRKSTRLITPMLPGQHAPEDN